MNHITIVGLGFEGIQGLTLEAYEKLAREFPLIFKKGEEVIERSSPNEAMALRYFYTAMPLSDMENYDVENFLDFARQGVYLWDNVAWVKDLPLDIFLNYVPVYYTHL